MRYKLILLGILICSVPAVHPQVSIGIGFPGVSIGINLPVYPEFVRVPSYPVYYAPRLNLNFFFFDGMYWVFQGDNWYASSWYNGPWGMVSPEYVPLYVLRIPVRYYRQPPAYFRGWRRNSPPRWGRHWGHEWEQHRSGWDRWDRQSAPNPAPLPDYQRQYSGDRYPRQVEQQYELHQQNYGYQPRDPVVRQHYEEQTVQKTPARQERREAPDGRGAKQQDSRRSDAPQTRGQKDLKRSAPTHVSPQQEDPAGQDQKQQQGAAAHEQRTQDSSRNNSQQGKGKRVTKEQKRKQDEEQDSEENQEQGQNQDQKHNR